MSLRPIDLTPALRPHLLPDEILLFVQDAVGLYAGKNKLPDYQNGHAYLTSHRACYVDNDRPRQRAVAVDLRDVERCEIYARFLKSSPKVTLTPKAIKFLQYRQETSPSLTRSGEQTPIEPPYGRSTQRTPVGTDRTINATWICPICSFSNPVPSNFDPAASNDHTPLPPCLNCGIKPPLVTVVKAAIASLSSRAPLSDPTIAGKGEDDNSRAATTDARKGVICPRCTFLNHPSLPTCEICGVALPTRHSHPNMLSSSSPPSPFDLASRSSSPAVLPDSDSTEGIKFSFRSGGEKIFHQRLQSALIQKKWLLQSAPPPPRSTTPNTTTYSSPAGNASTKADANAAAVNGADPPAHRGVGIAGLERRGLEQRKKNEVVISNAFEDLAALMASAKEIIALAETFSRQQAPSSAPGDGSGDQDPTHLLSQLDLTTTTTRDMLSPSSSSSAVAGGDENKANSLYHRELARSLAEFLTDDARAVLKNSGGVIPLVDLWAVFNRARGGVELVSPTDFAAAVGLFEGLGLPVRLRRFRSGVAVVQERARTDEKTVAGLVSWLAGLREEDGGDDAEATAGGAGVKWDARSWGRGVTAQETAERFGWSVGVAVEELEMAEERGALCRETCLEGVRFWENWLVG